MIWTILNLILSFVGFGSLLFWGLWVNKKCHQIPKLRSDLDSAINEICKIDSSIKELDKRTWRPKVSVGSNLIAGEKPNARR